MAFQRVDAGSRGGLSRPHLRIALFAREGVVLAKCSVQSAPSGQRGLVRCVQHQHLPQLGRDALADVLPDPAPVVLGRELMVSMVQGSEQL